MSGNFDPNLVGRCPHPFKRVWVTPQAALEACTMDRFLAPYRCPCGAWHIGHSRGAKQKRKRIRRMVRESVSS